MFPDREQQCNNRERQKSRIQNNKGLVGYMKHGTPNIRVWVIGAECFY